MKAAAVLGRAVLWACIDPITCQLVPKDILSRVQGEYELAHILDPGTNPVRKVGLVVCGHEGQLFIDDSAADDEARASWADATTFDLNLKRKRHSSELQVISSQLTVLRKQNEVLSTKVNIMKNHISKNLKYVADTMN